MAVLMTRQAKGAAQRALRMPFVLPAGVPLPVYLLEHMCVMALFAFLGALLMRVVVRSARPIIR